MKRLSIPAIVLGWSAVTLCVGLSGAPPLQAGPKSQVRPVLSRASAPETVPAASNDTIRTYCVGCHNQRTKTAGLTLDAMDFANVA